MSGIYFHIPFCKQACHYCDFHFSTSLKRKEDMILAMKKELYLRKNKLSSPVKTIYFGGGTPSLLSRPEIEDIIAAVYSDFEVEEAAEVTLEANPDDLDRKKVLDLSESPINRISLGIQSFDQGDLKFMNRAHDDQQALNSMNLVLDNFENVSIDLIYGIPGMTDERWKQNLNRAFQFPLQHLSSYALTVEPKTALAHFIKTGQSEAPSEDSARRHFEILMEEADKNQLIHYEVSNFAKDGFWSRHNTSYWMGESYLGIGPSAHSYSVNQRSWNPSNNAKYRAALASGKLAIESEDLSKADQMNEMIMTGLRTIWGLSLSRLESKFGAGNKNRVLEGANKYLEKGLLTLNGDQLIATPQGFFLVDGITADLFVE